LASIWMAAIFMVGDIWRYSPRGVQLFTLLWDGIIVLRLRRKAEAASRADGGFGG